MKSGLVALVLLALPALAQETKQHFVINVGTPEGQMLQSIGQDMDDAAKLTLTQEFLTKYPKHEGAPWVCGIAQSIYLKQKEWDKVLDAGDKGLAVDPGDLDLAFHNLKAAEGKEDADLIKKWSAKTSENAHKILADKAPADDEAKQRAEFAKESDTYSEYALSAAAAKSQDPKKVVELVGQLEQQNPKSQYLATASGIYLLDLQKTAGAAKACAAADRIGTANGKDIDALIFAGQCSLQGSRFDKAVNYGTKAQEALSGKPDARKSAVANWIVGVGYGGQQRFGPSNKALRAALPAIRGDAQLAPTALFYLGLANYQLGKPLGDKRQMTEGLQFFQQCAEMSGPLQDQASKNVRLIKTELGVH
jgi:tetratricopeptide (TPR) repeat protein